MDGWTDTVCRWMMLVTVCELKRLMYVVLARDLLSCEKSTVSMR